MSNLENCKTLVRENVETLVNMLPAYKLEELARDCAAKRFEAETGLQVDTSVTAYGQKLYPYLFSNVGLDMFSSPSDNLKRLENILKENNLSIETVKELFRWRHLFKECYFKHVDGDEYSIHGSYYVDELVDFVSMLATGSKSEHKIRAEDYGINSSATDFSFTINDITVKKYKNGRLTIKGVTPGQLKVFNWVYNEQKSYTEFLRKQIA